MTGHNQPAAFGNQNGVSPTKIFDRFGEQINLSVRVFVGIARVGFEFIDGDELIECAPDFDASGEGFGFDFSRCFGHADPEGVNGTGLTLRPSAMGNTLSLDIGTTTGWAVRKPDEVLSGSWLLATAKELRQQRKVGRERTGDIRFFRLHERITQTIGEHAIENIVFEDVLFLSSQAQSQLWASLRTAVWMAAESHRVECVHTGTLKKFATGAGNARKEAMVAAVANLPPPWGRVATDDNEADAVLILRWWEAQNAACSMCATLPDIASIRGK